MTNDTLKKNGNTETVARKPRRVVAPRCDVHETDKAIHVVAEMPGVDPAAVEVTLERNVLMIAGSMQGEEPAGFELLWREFEPVDYRRAFELSGDADASGVKAAMQNGILRVEIPKAAPERRTIPVTTG